METSRRNKDTATQREFERLGRRTVATKETVVTTRGGGAPTKAASQDSFALAIKYTDITPTTTRVLSNANTLNFQDSVTATWSINKTGSTADIAVEVNGVMPDGTEHQTLRHNGTSDKDWIADSRMINRGNTNIAYTSGIFGAIEIRGLSDEVPALHVRAGSLTSSTAIRAESSFNYAVHASATGDTPIAAIYATGDYLYTQTVGVHGFALIGTGVYGQTETGYGVRGLASNSAGGAPVGYGVMGVGVNATGVYGNSTDHIGVYGLSTNGIGIFGWSINDTGGSFRSQEAGGKGLYAYNDETGSFGIHGQANGSGGIGIKGEGTLKSFEGIGLVNTDTAYHVGDVQVVGAQGAAVANAALVLLDIQTQFNTLLARLRAHGLIAT